MSTSKEKRKSRGLIKCSSCEFVYSSKNAENHVKICRLLNDHTIIEAAQMHGCVSEQLCFTDCVMEAESSSSDQSVERIHISLSEEVMETMKLTIGGAVGLFDVTGRIMDTAVSFPVASNGTDLLRVVVPRGSSRLLGDNIKRLVIVKPHSILTAERLTLSAINSKQCHSSPAFRRYLKLFMVSKLVALGQSIRVQYFGQEMSFCVEDVFYRSGSDPVVTDYGASYSNSLQSDNLRQQLQDLSLNADTSSDNSMLCTSTPNKHTFVSLDQSLNNSAAFSASYDARNFDISILQNLFKSFTIFRVVEDTNVVIKSEKSLEADVISFSSIAGYENVKHQLTVSLLNPIKVSKVSCDSIPLACQTFLLHGTTGCGKTVFCKALQNECEIPVFSFPENDTQQMQSSDEDFNKTLHDIFTQAFSCGQLCLVLVDDLGVFLSSKSRKDQGKKICSLLDEARAHKVYVVCTADDTDCFETALRRRFDLEIEIAVPTSSDRAPILRQLLESFKNTFTDDDVTSLADRAHGYMPSDLMALCRQAQVFALQRFTGDTSCAALPSITVEDALAAMVRIRPTAMKEISLEVPKVYWSDIGGLSDVKMQLKQSVEWPLKHPDVFARLGITPPSGILLYGPPGCSKTMIAKAVATESGLNFLAVKGPELFSKWVGDSEKAIRDIFRRARAAAPCVVFFDEIDAVASSRGRASASGNLVGERVLTQLLTELNGIEVLGNVIFLAATNRPDSVDRALLRPGRLDRIVYIPLPDQTARKEILSIRLRKTPVADDVNLAELAQLTDGYSGAELVALCNEAALSAMRECLDIAYVHKRHFEDSLSHLTPRTDKTLLDVFREFQLSCQLKL